MQLTLTNRQEEEWSVVAARLADIARAKCVMQRPQYVREPWRQLVEGSLRIDLLNVYHASHQLRAPDAEDSVEAWIDPKHLGHACYFGRVDVVCALIVAGAPLDGQDYGGDPISAAMGAWVTTPLHVECVEALLEAGANLSLAYFSGNPEAIGSEIDADFLELFVRYGRRAVASDIRRRSEEIDLAKLRSFSRQRADRTSKAGG